MNRHFLTFPELSCRIPGANRPRKASDVNIRTDQRKATCLKESLRHATQRHRIDHSLCQSTDLPAKILSYSMYASRTSPPPSRSFTPHISMPRNGARPDSRSTLRLPPFFKRLFKFPQMDFEVRDVRAWRAVRFRLTIGADGDMGNVKPYNSAQEGLQVDIPPRNHTLAYFCDWNMLTADYPETYLPALLPFLITSHIYTSNHALI